MAYDSPTAAHGIPAARSERYHELDSLRAGMMMLGVALHAAVAYMQTPLGDLWGYKDARTHLGFDVFVAFLHTFRIPVFFVLAGFFAALLLQRRGEGHMIRNRAHRVLGPLVIGWIVVFPVTIAGFAFAQQGASAAAALAALRYATGVEGLRHLQLLHLWFLLDLLIYYAAALAVSRSIQFMRPGAKAFVLDAFGRLVRRWYAPLIFAAVTALTLIPMKSGMLETPGTFDRPIATLIADGVFFVFGWLLYLRRERLSDLGSYAWQWSLVGLSVFPIHALALLRLSRQPSALVHAVAITSLAVMAWLCIFGFTGLAVRYLGRPSPLRRYLADASYWFYLVHLPLVAWGSGLLSRQDWPAAVKYFTLLSAVVVICGATYDILVRPTILGTFLNGRRYPRGLPRVRRAPEQHPGVERAEPAPSSDTVFAAFPTRATDVRA